eukprot:TRINITY_DN7222_c0_g1_i2.p1 TRINITY_DN7222_c0_g1~~TRINITY_DN7222_c0_g1_i2.p1  ORF type:complete len:171 (-),score=23.78 TRINITY_DN7222_c0_g1_i2:562-1020(-)
MGKNQQWKDIQRARHARGAEVPLEFEDGRVDVTFHTPEWHAARIASLQVNRLPWDEWQKQRKEQAAKNDLAAAEERMMREYRAQLDAERELKLKKMSSRSLDEDDDSYSKKSNTANKIALLCLLINFPLEHRKIPKRRRQEQEKTQEKEKKG